VLEPLVALLVDSLLDSEVVEDDFSVVELLVSDVDLLSCASFSTGALGRP
jgi:hypothetical protein